MLGTIVNTGCIIGGTIAGALLNRGIDKKYSSALYNALGLVSVAIGLNATLGHMGKSNYPLLYILAMAIGAVVGTMLNIDGRFKQLITAIKNRRKTTKSISSESDGTKADDGGSRLAEGLSTAILLYCIGPLSMLGPMVSALKGDNTLLYTNATLDLVSATVFAATYGWGMVAAAPVLFCWQGLFYLVAIATGSMIDDALMADLFMVGGLLITASGLSLLKIKDCKTLNLLPALAIPPLWYLAVALWNG